MTRNVFALGVVLVTAAMLATGTQVTQAQDAAGAAVRLETTAQTAAAIAAYWTPERLASARPRTPVVAATVEAPFEPQLSGVARWSNGRPPEPGSAPNMRNFLYHPSLVSNASAGDDVTPNNAGTLSAHFTSSRVIPYGAVGVYPFRAAGKLFFSDGAERLHLFGLCDQLPRRRDRWSLRPRGKRRRRQGSSRTSCSCRHTWSAWRPSGRGPSAFVVVTNTWATGGGGVPNAADYAMMEMQDRAASPTRIGSVTGFLGWQTISLNPNHVTMLGYPFGFDSAELMHRVDAGAFRNTAPNNVEYGSDMTGGSSGGPWVQNFGEPSIGQTGGTNPGLNRVVGVTSYGFVSPDPKVQGASVPDQRWVDLFNLVCAHRAGNCTQ